MKKFINLFVLIIAFASTYNSFGQGNTTASINGTVLENEKISIPGASVLAVHTPSGTRYVATTNEKGSFRISNMRVGGPYKVTFSYVGFKTYEENDVYLQLGESSNFKIILVSEISELKEVVVKGTKDATFNSKKTGAQTIVDARKIASLPSLSRNIADFARLTPQAQLRGDDQLSIGGQNNRFNAIYIDGAVNNDVFGLAANGTNGGQTGVSPISIDAIEQFQISIAPYDVKLSGFAGGSISAITRSGTNNFDGSAYFLTRNQNFVGMTPPDVAGSNARTKLADFTANTYGVRAGGALIKDKLFYFVNYENQNNETPLPFDINNYTGNIGIVPGSSYNGAVAENKINELKTYLGKFGYDPGSYNNNVASLKSDKITAKLDWNINDNNKLSLKHQYVKAVNFSPSRSSITSLNFTNGAQNFKSTTNSTALELNSKFGNRFSNNLVVGYTTVLDDRGIAGNPFPSVEIRDGAGGIFIGSEAASTANLLDQKTFTVTDNFEIATGNNTITIGTNNEFNFAKNLFLNRNFGEYRFDNIKDFLDNARPNRYRLTYSLLGGSGDDSAGAAEFNMSQFGAYVQNEMKLSNSFKLSYGIRVDVPVWEDGKENADFNNRTIPLLQAAGKDLKGARVGKRISNYGHLSPRLGFNYNVNGLKKTQIRGGVGIFTSRLPLVWPAGTYNNNGVGQGSVQLTTKATNPLFDPSTNVLDQLYAGTTPIAPNLALPGSGAVGGAVDLFAENFRLPQVFKASFAVDQKLPWGFVASADITFNDNISGIKYENVNISKSTATLTGADTRTRYNSGFIDSKYNNVILASNTSDGEAFNAAFTLTKNFKSKLIDLSLSGTFAYGESTVLFDGTSSVNASQWQFIETVNGSNNIDRLSRSDFDQGSRVLGTANIDLKWSKFTKSRIGLFYEGAQGTPFSYVYNDNGRLLRDTFQNSALIFVPAKQSDINLVQQPGNPLNAQQQWEQLDNFISNDPYLNSRRGQYAERNGNRLATSHVIDLKFAQEFILNVKNKKHVLEFTADIFNFTNLLNKDWGKKYFASNDQVLLLTQVGFLADTTTPTFNFNPSTALKSLNQVDDAGLQSSRWQMQFGVRYSFY